MTYLHAKVQGQQLVGSEDRVETDGEMNGGDRMIFCTNAVGRH